MFNKIKKKWKLKEKKLKQSKIMNLIIKLNKKVVLKIILKIKCNNSNNMLFSRKIFILHKLKIILIFNSIYKKLIILRKLNKK